MSDKSAPKIVLGSISGVFGIRGWIKVFSETEPRENIVAYKQWWLRAASDNADWQCVKVMDGRKQGKTVVAQLEGIDTPEAAQQLIGQTIAVERSQMPSLAAGEYYWADLIDHQVVNRDGDLLGRVDRLFSTGANDVLVVTTEASSAGTIPAEILIPWIPDSVILEVDIPQQRIRVDWEIDY